MAATAILADLHGAASALASDNYPLSRAVGNLLSGAVINADDTFAGQDVDEETWAEKALSTLEMILCHEPDVTVRNWFLSQGFTF